MGDEVRERRGEDEGGDEGQIENKISYSIVRGNYN